MRLTFFFVALAIFPATVFAQAEIPRESESVQVNLVEIPVNVFDRSGEPVRGLGPENFEVYDDGRKRKITHFEEIDLVKLSTSELRHVHSPAARRSFMVVFDLTNSRPRTLLRAQEAAEKFLRSAVRERDLVAVATFSIEQGFRILTSFTTDRELATLAVRQLGSSRFYESQDPLLLANTRSNQDQTVSSEQSFLQESAMELQGIIGERTNHLNEQYFRQRVERQLNTFGQIARMLNSVRGRKQMVLLSEGFSGQMIHGREETPQEEQALYRGEVWRIDNDQRFGSASTLRHLDEMAELFRRSDVVLHSIDIQGIPEATNLRSGAPGQESGSLYLMSNATGGQLFHNSNDLTESFAKMLRQQEVIYILGFQSTPTGNPGKFHDLAVKVKVVGHRGLRVTNRAGYYEPRTQISAVEQALSATDILMNDIPFEDVEVNLLAAPFPLQGSEEMQVPVIAEISGADLLQRVSGNALNAEIFIYAFDEEGRVRDFLFQTVSFDLTSTRGVLEATGIKYYGTLSLPPGNYAMKCLVRVAESGSNGFRRVEVEIPQGDRPFILPPLVFEEPGQWIMLKAARTAAAQTDYPFLLLENSFIPSARPRFENQETYKLALFTFNLPSDDMELIARLEGEDGSQRNPPLKLIGRTIGEKGATKLLLDFSSEDLPAGRYSLRITARTPDGRSSPEASLPLDIGRE